MSPPYSYYVVTYGIIKQPLNLIHLPWHSNLNRALPKAVWLGCGNCFLSSFFIQGHNS
ncbi:MULTISPECIES: hypothetical protein [Psychrobacter]|uniref:hypothetical protein n=1 Tax=Psychrobacter TaxID=497 RepID=UPI00146C6C1D|nr:MULTISPECIES: hypothetical protein [Psychrobacter]